LIHALLLVLVTVGERDAPPVVSPAGDVALEQEALPAVPQRPCVHLGALVTPRPEASPHACSIVVDGPLEPGPEVEAPDASWMQASHDLLERGINALVLDLDRFFGDALHEPYQPPTSHVRLRNEVRSGEDDSLQAGVSVAGHLRLPAANRMLGRVRLFFAGETEPQPLPGPDADIVPPRFNARVRSASGGLEARVDLARGRRTLLDVGAGARWGWPPPPFTRLRLAQGFPLGIRVVGHITQSLFWDRLEGFGESSRLDVERAFGARTLARWWSIGTIDEASRGFEWASEVGAARVLGAKTGLFTAAAIVGATRSPAHVERYRVYTRLRRDVYGGWAFVEVEPQIDWPADELTSLRSRVFSTTLRLELQFSSDGRRATPLPPFRAAAPPA
jgi:hypothetical protein